MKTERCVQNIGWSRQTQTGWVWIAAACSRAGPSHRQALGGTVAAKVLS